MYQICTRKLCAFLCLLLINTFTAYSQCNPTAAPCETAIDESFNGSEGSFKLGSDFTYNTNVLRSGNRGGQNSRTLDTLHSGFYVAGSVGSVLTHRFTLAAQNQGGNVTSYQILARYGPGTNDVVVLCSGGALAAGSPCFGYTVDPRLAGKRFRFEFIFTIGGSGVQARISFDNFATNVPESANQFPLPVTFTGFEGRKTETGIKLTWKVVSEINVKAYEVERSRSGKDSFEKIGTVAATGAPSYSFTDAVSHTGTVFYRIKNVDKDGVFKHSGVISFDKGTGTVVVRVLPTVVTSKTSVEHGVAKGTELITLSTGDGRVVRTLRPSAGAIKTAVEMSDLRPGLYLLKWSDGKAVQTVKVVKQ